MSKWREQPIYIWFSDKYDTGDENCLPYNPEHFYIHSTTNNEEIDMLKGAVSVKKLPKLLQYEPIESFFAHPDIYRYMRSKDGEDWSPDEWVDFFQSAIDKKKTLELTVTGINWVDEVTVEDFQYGKKAGVEKDTYFSLQIKQFKKPIIKTENITIVPFVPPQEEKAVALGVSSYGSGSGAPKKSIAADAYITGGIWSALPNALSNPTLGGWQQTMFGVKEMPVSYEVVGEAYTNLALTETGVKLIRDVKSDLLTQRNLLSPQFISLDGMTGCIKKYSDDPAVVENFKTYFKEKYGSGVKQMPRKDIEPVMTEFVTSLVKSGTDYAAANVLNKGGSLSEAVSKSIDYSRKYENNRDYKNSYVEPIKETVIKATIKEDVQLLPKPGNGYKPAGQAYSNTPDELKAGTVVYTQESSLRNNGEKPAITTIDKIKNFISNGFKY